jgi:hypothetical protein
VNERFLIQSPRKVLAIDPGLSGAVVKLGGGCAIANRDFKEIGDIAKSIQRLSPSADVAVLEHVHAMPGQGVSSCFSFGRAEGAAWGALACCREDLTPVVVSPVKWQNFFRERDGVPRPHEFDSRALASLYLPSKADLFSRKKDHNTADAFLMAIWFLLTFKEDSSSHA